MGADERVGAEEEGGLCCAMQVDILFTKRVSKGGRPIKKTPSRVQQGAYLGRHRGMNLAGTAVVPLQTRAWPGSESQIAHSVLQELYC